MGSTNYDQINIDTENAFIGFATLVVACEHAWSNFVERNLRV